jgi:hypothetical protein
MENIAPTFTDGSSFSVSAEYRARFDALDDADPNSKDVQDILSMFDRLDEGGMCWANNRETRAA